MQRMWIFFMFLLGAWALAGCGSRQDIREEILAELGLELQEVPVLKYVDTHGGFHGDGMTYAVFWLDVDSQELELAFTGERCWRRLPMSENTKRAAYGDEEWSSVLEYEEDIPMPPFYRKGWYYFADRHDKSVDEADDTEFLDRGSFNFTMAFYNAENQRLYYYRLDT